jgi:cell division protein FtsB
MNFEKETNERLEQIEANKNKIVELKKAIDELEEENELLIDEIEGLKNLEIIIKTKRG